MKQFSPAGMAVKGFFGLRSKSFGNPDGAATGGGAYAKGGANANGPNQGGGGGAAPGNTWRLGMTAIGAAQIVGLASDNVGNTICIDQNGVVYKSGDGGKTWVDYSTVTASGAGGNPGNLAWGDNKFVFSRNPTQAYVSGDDGLSWNPIATGIPTAANRFGYIATDGVGDWVITSNAQPSGIQSYSSSTNNAVSFSIAGNVSSPQFVNTPPLWDGVQYVTPGVGPAILVSPDHGLTWNSTASNSSVLRWIQKYSGGYVCASAGGGTTIRLSATAAGLGTAADTAIPGYTGTVQVVGANGANIFAFSSTGTQVAYSPDGGVTWTLAASNFAAGDEALCLCFDSTHKCFIAGGFNGGVITNAS